MRSTAVISSKGQIVIPANPNAYEAIYALQGSLRKFPLEASLDTERRAERKRENAR
jgi:hypothetical protein